MLGNLDQGGPPSILRSYEVPGGRATPLLKRKSVTGKQHFSLALDMRTPQRRNTLVIALQRSNNLTLVV
jgi:hypothetical protein